MTTLRSRRALFLDRDGVINVNHGYVYKREDCDFVSGIFDLCRAAQVKDYKIFIVTNQSGIARGFYSQEAFYSFSRWLRQQFWLRGVSISHTYHCPHHPKQASRYGISCVCRKPRPGMLFRARKDFRINMQKSLMVGDSLSDIHCALNAGMGKAVLLKAKAQTFAPELEAPDKKPYYRANKLKAIQSIL